MGHRQTDLSLGLPSLPIIPPADLAVVTAPSQQVAVLGVELAGDQVEGRVELQVGLGGILWTSISISVLFNNHQSGPGTSNPMPEFFNSPENGLEKTFGDLQIDFGPTHLC